MLRGQLTQAIGADIFPMAALPSAIRFTPTPLPAVMRHVKEVNCIKESDRLVRGRAALDGLRARLRRGAAKRHCSALTHDMWYPHCLHRKRYIAYLDQALLEEDVEENDPVKSKFEGFPKPRISYETPHWPCVPRRESYLSSADSVLDLPSYRHSPFSDLLDWGGRDVLVAALGRDYYKWSWRSQSLVGRGEAHALVNVCKFDLTGELLTLGTVAGTVEIHHMGWGKCVARHRCECARTHRQVCAITALHWSPTGNAFATGCSRGTVCAWSRSCRAGASAQAAGHVHATRVSPDARLLATAPLHARRLQLWTWPALQPFRLFDTEGIVKTICWHPWRSALLSVGCSGDGGRATLVLWEAAAGRLRHSATLGLRAHVLDAALYSPRTGELVLSLWYPESLETSEAAGSRLLVFGDTDTVVDQLDATKWSLDRVKTMMFNPDGTKLATATTEEDLIIWNFLPEDKHGRRKIFKTKNFAALPVHLDRADCGYSFR